jgi:hypothetical protein
MMRLSEETINLLLHRLAEHYNTNRGICILLDELNDLKCFLENETT